MLIPRGSLFMKLQNSLVRTLVLFLSTSFSTITLAADEESKKLKSDEAISQQSDEQLNEAEESNETEETYPDGYQLPTSPTLYDKKGNPGDPIQFDSGLYLGLGFGFGQSNASGRKGNAITSYDGHLEVGYRFGTGAWSRLEGGVEFFMGATGFSQGKIAVGPGVLIKGGYGKNLGRGVYSVFSLGGGLASAKYKGESNAEQEIKDDSAVSGLVIDVAYSLQVPISDKLSLAAGLDGRWMNFNLDDTMTVDGSSLDERVKIQQTQLTLGVRIQI